MGKEVFVHPHCHPSPLVPIDGVPMSDRAIEKFRRKRGWRIARMSETEKSAQLILKSLSKSHGLHFRPQQVMVISEELFFVVDFWFPHFRYVLEVDGNEHREQENRIADQYRWQLIAKKGYGLMRISNETVRNRREFTAEKIIRVCVTFGHRHGVKMMERHFHHHPESPDKEKFELYRSRRINHLNLICGGRV